MIQKSLDKQTLHFRRTYELDGIHIVWLGSRDCTIRFPLNSNEEAALHILKENSEIWGALEELWQDDFLKDNGPNQWIIFWEAMDSFQAAEDSPLDILGIPRPDPLDVEVLSRGSVADKAFRASVEIRHPIKGTIRDGDYSCPGPVLIFDKSSILPLSPEMRLLLEAARGRDVDWDDLESRMAYLAHVKLAARQAGARLDSYFRNENYEIADTAHLDIREDSPEEITLIPRVPNIDEFDPSGGEALLSDRPPSVLSRPGPGLQRKRLIIDKKLRKDLSQLPPKGKVRGVDVPVLLTNPEQIVPEGFDLSLFSQRVKGIKTRVYNSRPYIHVRRSQVGGWFEGVPGVEVEDWSPSDRSDGQEDSTASGLSPETYRELAQRAKETGNEYVRWNDGWIRIDSNTSDRFEDILDNLTPQDDGSLRLPTGSILDIYENLSILEFVDKKSLKALEGDLMPADLPDDSPPINFNGQLYPYQVQGYQWLSRLGKYQLGGLLADDMGLGKTVQVIAHIMQLKNMGSLGPHLIIVPKTLLENWWREINRFSDNLLSVLIYHSGHCWPGAEGFDGYDIVLTTYETLRRDQARMATIDWDLVACDEAQYAKNPTAQRTSAVKALKSKHRAALTGTPVENGLIEFWCIMDFVQPGLLGSWNDFRANYERPIISSATEEREIIIRKLLKEIRGHYLRRLKSEILKDLPPKVANHRRVPLDDKQLQLYREIARQGRSGGKGAALGAIQRLLIMCANPWGSSCAGANNQTEYSFPKLNETLSILKNIRSLGEKAIVFTDFKVVQRMLQSAIRNKFGIWPDIINGDLNSNRQAVIDVFSQKQGFNVIILGHQVAGVGLNITAANHVIHYTRPWNPAKENQATDRTHRIGQSKPVHIYYPIVTNDRFTTVEERLDELLRSKEDLARDVLRPSVDQQVKIEELLDCLDEV
ncbi:MAG TPA: DEAD/DEAH box helicase [Syntrophales bacterium]|nr:DEAD/DEAH box helicase [Syntrophales bacterium]HPL66977.1 DEAD/DEAH box helicase [Smithellaceae bacterium]HQG34537.1 DEAD/DEAH box helicase [Syntrophales bacterium]HQI36137.1 DEAD/DEAH box helicase [Syntrophales bacterium]HRR47871.1 DEAD/DEAH box helicase [Syntrophales bacterium]